MDNPSVSIIIPTPGDNPLLSDCLTSIRGLHYRQSAIQTLVITNADVEKRGKPFSFAAAVNQAASKATGDLILVTNDDVVFTPDSLSGWMKASRRYPNTILGAKILDTTTNRPAASGYMLRRWTGIAKPVYAATRPVTCDWIAGCALLVSRKIWTKLGGLDERFAPGYFEDSDFCARARKSGIESLIIPGVTLFHKQTTSFNRDKSAKYEYWYCNKFLFLRRHASPLELATALIIQYACLTPARAVFLRDDRFLPAIKGLLWNIRNWVKELHDQPSTSS